MHRPATKRPCRPTGLLLIPLLVAAGCASQPPQAISLADRCYHAATVATEVNQPAEMEAGLCDRALTIPLSRRLQAATYNNRGILRLNRSAYAQAKQDFDQAIGIAPELGETWVNRGAALLGLHRYAEALDNLNRGIELNTSYLERAFYNRAMARERLNDIKGAYYDYLKASQLRPDWSLPKQDLQRFRVITRGNAVA